MLTSLHIENIAVIESADIDFPSGLVVLTGETGAGKSVLIDSVNTVLGSRASRDLIRHGASRAFVSAVFEDVGAEVLDEMRRAGIEPDGGTVIISRELRQDSRNTFRVNGIPATSQTVQRLGAMLISIHGQHDSQKLLDESRHIEILDAMGAYGELKEEYAEKYRSLFDVRSRLEKLLRAAQEKSRRTEYLTEAIAELTSAAVKPGEREELEAERVLIMNSEKITNAVCAAKESIDGGDSDGMAEIAAKSCRQLHGVSKFSPECGKYAEKLDGISSQLQEISFGMSDLLEKLSFDPMRQEQVEERLHDMERLSRKYSCDSGELPEKLKDFTHELESLNAGDEEIERLKTEFDLLKSQTHAAARRLTEARTETADEFLRKTAAELEFLDMKNVTLRALIEKAPLSLSGADKVVFLISANPGEPAKSISKIASGGELSRIMLALKCVISAADDIPTLIFDEIDTGVSGKNATKIAIKLREVSKTHQVICVTHLAQIAAYAGCHLLITKSFSETSTSTHVRVLDHDGRVEELSRILGSSTITDVTRENARELISQANP